MKRSVQQSSQRHRYEYSPEKLVLIPCVEERLRLNVSQLKGHTTNMVEQALHIAGKLFNADFAVGDLLGNHAAADERLNSASGADKGAHSNCK